MKHILIASPTMGSYGGIEAFCLELVKSLQAENVFKVQLALKLVSDFQVDDRLKSILEKSNIDYRIVGKSSNELFQLIKSVDLVHAQNASPDIALMSKLCSAKLVQTIHNHLYGRTFARTLSWKLGALLADARLYNSKFVQESWGYQHETKDKVIPTVSQLAMNFAPFEPRQGFVFISRLIPNKGADILLRAYSQAQIDQTEYPLSILGDGPMREPLIALAKELQVDAQFHGFVEEETKQQLIRQSRWLVAPPNTREDMGLTPLEARANGIPVIATRDGGIPESAGPGSLLCTPGSVDELAQLLEQAVEMGGAEYQKKSHLAYSSLKDHLTPMSFYPDLYRRLLPK